MRDKLKNILDYFGLRYFRLKLHEKLSSFLYSTISKKEKYIYRKFKEKLNYEIDFNSEPKTFNQKIQFRKLYDGNPLYSICADKYRVRKYVKEKIGEKYLIPLYLVTEKLTMEQWEKLPNSFVAKANHNSGPVQIVRDKRTVNAKNIIKELNNQLKIDYGIISMEKYYSDIPRKIVIEYLLEDKNRKMLQDVKIHCFNNDGIRRFFFDLRKRESTEAEYYSVIYSEKWENLKITNSILDNDEYKKPENIRELLAVAQKLSEDFEYVRVDLYNIENKIFFGELTFCECSGYAKFNKEAWDYKFGEYWK